jgi:type II secretory pathway component PulM
VEAQRAQLGRSAERMQALQARARLLQSKPLAAPGDILKALQDSARAQGKTVTLQVLGEQATITLRQISATALAAWLTPVSGALLSPVEAHLQRDPGGSEALWSGTLVFRLPAATPAKP